jgi:hypothetical protein
MNFVSLLWKIRFLSCVPRLIFLVEFIHQSVHVLIFGWAFSVFGARVPLPLSSLFSAEFPSLVGPSRFLSPPPGLACLLALSSLECGASYHEPKDSCGEASDNRPVSHAQGPVHGLPPRSAPGLYSVSA